MKQRSNIVGFAFIVLTVIAFAQTPSTKTEGDDWSSILIETDKGYWPLTKYEQAARKHLQDYDPSFADFKQKTAFIRRTNEIAIEYSSGLGKHAFRVCMNRNFQITGVNKFVSMDAIGDPSAGAAPSPILCD